MTQVQRTILINQNRILSKLTNDGSYDTIADLLDSGYTGQYHRALVSDEETSEEICRETTDILQMYRVIRNSFAELSEEEQATLEMDKISFQGFDNHESHYHYACFMIEKLDLWAEYEGQDIDSHSGASIIKYRRMLEIYNRHYGKPEYDLNREVLQEMIDAV